MISLKNIQATYTTTRGKVTAVDNVNLEIPEGIILGIAGESGCGKSTLLKVIYGNIDSPLSLEKGQVEYGFTDAHGTVVTSDNIREHWFKNISYIPQSSMSSMNPVTRIRQQFVDHLDSSVNKKIVLDQVREYIQKLDLPPEAIDAYPHQLSGGMRQRIMVAMGTYFNPSVILADEPTTALDVVVQKGILLLLMDIQEEMKNTIFFVSHDMGVHYQITHKMLIMYAAKAVEFGSSDVIFKEPLHPYTKMLINALPTIGDEHHREGVSGRPPSLWDNLVGCRFAARCPLASDVCRTTEPAFEEFRPGHFVACHHSEQTSQIDGRS